MRRRVPAPARSWPGGQTLAAFALMAGFLIAGCVPLPEAKGDRAGPARLVARRVNVAPVVDGATEETWAAAQPLVVPLTWGAAGTERAYTRELRAVHTDDALFLLARWPDAARLRGASGAPALANKLTMHWRIPPPASGLAPPACDVACHGVYPFSIKVFEGREDRADPVSALQTLVFAGDQ